MKNIVVFASGSGSNFQAVIEAAESGKIDCSITGLITNKKSVGAIEKAGKAGIPFKIMNPSEYRNPNEYAKALSIQLEKWQPDLVVLAGYLAKIPASIIRRYRDQIINIHPSLLPKYGGKGYYGERVHKAVLEAGETQSGCTVHFVNEVYDDGPIIAQKKVKVYPDDTPKTLAARILKEEHKLLPSVIQKILNQK